MNLRVLGTAVIEGHPPHGPRLERKARELLAVLTLRAPAAVTLEELTDLLWDEPPPSATKVLRSHLSRVRSALRTTDHGPAIGADPRAGLEAGIGADLVRSGPSGYRLVVDPDRTDIGRVQAARERARRLRADQRPDVAASMLAEARAEWRSDPELPATVAGAALAQAWRAEHALLVREHLAALVAGTDPCRALGELAGLVHAHPLEESLWVQYVTALRRVGRQSDALNAVAAARSALDDVGLEPTAALREAQAQVYARPEPVSLPAPQAPNPSVAGPDTRYAVGPSGSTAYAQLSRGGHPLVVLNPAMITLDGLLDDPHPKTALEHLCRVAEVICLDRHGIGLSDPLDPERAPLDQWVEDVVRVLDVLEVARTDLFANFDTGLIALELAARHPERVRSMVLAQCYATYQRTPDYPYGLDRATAESLIRDSTTPDPEAEPIDTVAQVAPSLAGDDDFRRWWNLIGRRAASPATALAIRTAAISTDLRDRLASVEVPALVLHRRACTNVDLGHARYLVAHLPSAELVITRGTDAVWFTDSPDLLDQAVAFLDPGR